MTDELNKSIERLRALAPKLNKTTDEANRTIQLVEKFLNDECNLGLPVSSIATNLDDTDGQPWVGYDRVGGKYRLVIGRNLYRKDDDGNIIRDDYGRGIVDGGFEMTPMSDCSRGEKLRALEYIPELLKKLASEAEAAIGSADGTIAAIRQIVGAIGDVKPEEPEWSFGETTPGPKGPPKVRERERGM